MKLGIISLDRDNIVNDLIKSCNKFEVDYRVINPKNIVAGFNLNFNLKYYRTLLNTFDVFFVRNLGWDSFFRFDVLKYLNKYVPVINPPNSIDIASNKFLTSMYLELKNLPQPKTVVTENITEALHWIETFKDVVIKPIFGCGGEGIIRIKKDMPIITKIQMLNEFQKKYKTFYIQEFIEPVGKYYRDIRVFVIDDEVVSAMYRIGGENWKNNVSQGAKIEKCKITEEIEDLALKAKDAIGLFYAGVDLIESEEGLKILEVNSTPSWRGLSIVSDINISDKLLEKIIQYIKNKE
ncbi:tetrahydromethanopterin:alpha-L-glutamate ligase [Methanocaldococcus sp.]|uniref:tetrahydromethanopterin:alpha-L-glutamate ligase n=1 Tax=Methanocaldococcus sp. TaxID=2152917 RepID=UPI002604888A|nr:tetrahydromethanopterin:alpha-L-glutamate ligase [Methanocaldococcus sp.]MCQ6254690.1 RimK family alpha-L-glutamate ligase [Methanocaldococcus sp.]